MTIKELDSKYTFHDSYITKIEYIGAQKRLDMYMDFCTWNQSGYNESESELVYAKLSFDGIENYNGLMGDIVYYSIENAGIKDGKYFLLIVDEFNCKKYELSLTPSSVSFEVLGPIKDN